MVVVVMAVEKAVERVVAMAEAMAVEAMVVEAKAAAAMAVEKAGIIGERGVGADGDGGKKTPEVMDVGLRLRTGDRPTLPHR